VQLLMQPVVTAVSAVCVRVTTSSFNSQNSFHYTGETKIIYGECSRTLSNHIKSSPKGILGDTFDRLIGKLILRHKGYVR
jgi:hypothetical protein